MAYDMMAQTHGATAGVSGSATLSDADGLAKTWYVPAGVAAIEYATDPESGSVAVEFTLYDRVKFKDDDSKATWYSFTGATGRIRYSCTAVRFTLSGHDEGDSAIVTVTGQSRYYDVEDALVGEVDLTAGGRDAFDALDGVTPGVQGKVILASESVADGQTSVGIGFASSAEVAASVETERSISPSAWAAGFPALVRAAEAEALNTIFSYPAAVKQPELAKRIVEDSSCGKATSITDDQGYPSMMFVMPSFNAGDIHADLGATTDTFPSHLVAGTFKPEVHIAMFKGTSYNGGGGARAVSWPGLYGTGSLDFDASKKLCTDKGAGWHLMSKWEQQAAAWWSLKNATEPRGNTDYGRSHESGYQYEAGRRSDGLMPGHPAGTAKHQNQANPTAWAHNGKKWGIYDLFGNMWEWVDQLKIVDGQVFLTADNDYALAESSWPASGVFMNSVGKLYDSQQDGATSGVTHTSQEMDATYDALGIAIRRRMMQAGISLRINSGTALPYSPKGYLYINSSGTRLPIVGGGWGSTSSAGLAALNLNNARSNVGDTIGFRPSYIAP